MGHRARVLGGLGAVVVLSGLLAFVPGAQAAPEPGEGTLTSDQRTVEWSGSFTAPAVVYPSGCDPEFCDVFALTVDVGERPADLTVVVEQPGELTAPLVEILDAEGEVLAEGSGLGGVTLEATNLTSGAYTVQVTNGDVLPNGSYTASATILPGQAPFEQSGETVRYDFDEEAPVGAVDVPLRVVMVGFEPESVDPAQIFSEIPDHQRVGSLYQYGGGTRGGDDSTLAGNDTLVNHARVYYDEEEPFVLPIEYRWRPELHYAPTEFTRGLFEAMVGSSTTGDYANPALRAYLDAYNATRGSLYRVVASGDPAQVVAPGAPVRFIDGEATEDWINANAEQHLGFPAGRDPGQPGYTVFVLNTWDSPEAQEVFTPGEYHVFKINRTDPDRGDFDGVDWARVWGGRYRFMMVDLGAAPNAYESETWGNRARSVNGSALYDPPLWEYRANAPRPVTAIDLLNGSAGIEQAVTPGEFWDDSALQHILARTVNQAVNFRFFHSYLYEPRPGTGRYFLSDNVWHDSTTVYDTDLELMYDQQAALTGLESLAPYLDFEGDVVYQYLDQSAEHPEYADDQAALDQAKQDGDDVAGAPHVSMHTDTMMDYIDSQPDRFLRGGECATTVPTIQVVVPGHYAWALPVAAGIATNRAGVPWGFLNSVNDVTKWNGADKDQTLVLAHPNVAFSGTFTYTTIHEASHYLGLAHPHDTVGATRNEDGSPRYYDGFAWTFNTTAAPTTYSHVETAYSILDQESIARGHFSYYVEWAGEALEESGQAWADRGMETIDALPARAAELRSTATVGIREARWHFSQFRFVDAAFAAQRAWRAAAEYRDLALELPVGTSQVENGTQLGTDDELAANECPAVEDTPPSPDFDPGPAPRADALGAAPAPHMDLPGTPAHTHAADGTMVPVESPGAAAATERAVAGDAASSDGRLPAGGPPLAAAGVAVALIVGVLRALARRAWT